MRLCVSGYKMPRRWCRAGWMKRYTEAMKRFLTLIPALVLLPGWPAFLAAQPRPAVIKIDSDRVIGEVDPRGTALNLTATVYILTPYPESH